VGTQIHLIPSMASELITLAPEDCNSNSRHRSRLAFASGIGLDLAPPAARTGSVGRIPRLLTMPCSPLTTTCTGGRVTPTSNASADQSAGPFDAADRGAGPLAEPA
jgi:hypothetical protein